MEPNGIYPKYDNLPSEYTPNNEWRFAAPKKADVIIPGAEMTHVFELPFWLSEQYKKIEVIYTQGTETRVSLSCNTERPPVPVETGFGYTED